jgi:pectate lyase
MFGYIHVVNNYYDLKELKDNSRLTALFAFNIILMFCNLAFTSYYIYSATPSS